MLVIIKNLFQKTVTCSLCTHFHFCVLIFNIAEPVNVQRNRSIVSKSPLSSSYSCKGTLLLAHLNKTAPSNKKLYFLIECAKENKWNGAYRTSCCSDMLPESAMLWHVCEMLNRRTGIAMKPYHKFIRSRSHSTGRDVVTPSSSGHLLPTWQIY